MYSVRLVTDTDILDAIADGARQAPALMTVTVRRNLSRLRSRALARLKAEPDAPEYPLRWKSARQRRAVMAKLRREGNLPYQRTHALSEGYDLELDTSNDNGVFSLTNDTPYFQFVSGDDAQPMHLDTGWLQIANEVGVIEDEIADVLIETWFSVAG